ncbi:MAG: hypothetical protein IJC20_02730 [Clostridia bacterium]|nr:hypothetical protein [Clostridia bacterium]
MKFYCIFKGFHKKLDYLTIVSLRSFFVKNNFVSLSLFQFADFVCKLRLPECISGSLAFWLRLSIVLVVLFVLVVAVILIVTVVLVVLVVAVVLVITVILVVLVVAIVLIVHKYTSCIYA